MACECSTCLACYLGRTRARFFATSALRCLAPTGGVLTLALQVIKIEDTEGGDYVRYYAPQLEDGNSASFHVLNRGKVRQRIASFRAAQPLHRAFRNRLCSI